MSTPILPFKTEQGTFSVQVPAKIVLTGEHSVLRGKHALAIPYPLFSLSLCFRPGLLGSGLSLVNSGHESEMMILVERGMGWMKENLFLRCANDQALDGSIEVQSTIPIGAGLGSSAALCWAIARLLFWKFDQKMSSEKVNTQKCIQLATFLEDVFHGKSSGLDVNVIAHEKPIEFFLEKGVGVVKILPILQLPKFELVDSGLRGLTIDCIRKVKEWRAHHSSEVNSEVNTQENEVDEKMNQSTQLAIRALENLNAKNELAEAMKAAQNCFETWGLVPDALLQQKKDLYERGALSVKLTGAGMGGFWIVLWPSA